MKNRILFLGLFAFFSMAAFGQSIGKLYKANQWIDVKGNGGFVHATENPTKEQVEILQTDKYFRVTLGNNVYTYTILSATYSISQSKGVPPMTEYFTVTINGKTYILKVTDMTDGSHSFEIQDEWYVTASLNSQ